MLTRSCASCQNKITKTSSLFFTLTYSRKNYHFCNSECQTALLVALNREVQIRETIRLLKSRPVIA